MSIKRKINVHKGPDQMDESSMAALLSKFRIKFSAVKVIDITKAKIRPEMFAF